MKVLQINISATSGSVGKIVNNLYWEIIKNGHECKVAYGKGGIGNIPFKDTYKIETKIGLYSHALCSRLFGKSGFYSKNATQKLLNWIDNYNPDVIHLHGAYGYYINMELLFKYISKHGIKLVSTLHSCWDFTGHCCYFDYPKCDQWKTGCYNCKGYKGYPQCLIKENTHKNLLKKTDLYNSLERAVIVTPSLWLSELAKQTFLSKHKIICINNGLDLNRFKIDSYPKFSKPTILCVANVWSKRKGLEDIIELAAYINKDIDIIVVGLSNKQIKELPANIVGITRTENFEELKKLYSQSTILFNPTYEENYPTVNIEAVACHLPVATYDTGGCRETIDYEKYGKLIAKKDYKAVLNYLYSVYKKDIEYDYDDLSFIDQNKMINSYLEVYNN